MPSTSPATDASAAEGTTAEGTTAEGTTAETTLSTDSGPSNVASKGDRSDATRARDPWAGKSILCLDGGGIRGISSLFIISSLMDRIREEERRLGPAAVTSSCSSALEEEDHSTTEVSEETAGGRGGRGEGERDPSSHPYARPGAEFLPCHYFDYICGTSTGGLIAMMLGRLRMPVHECLDVYRGLGEKFFGKQKPATSIDLVFSLKDLRALLQKKPRQQEKTKKAKKDKQPLESSFDELKPVFSAAGEEDTRFRSDAATCRTVVCAMDKSPKGGGLKSPHLYRSYEVDDDDAQHHHHHHQQDYFSSTNKKQKKKRKDREEEDPTITKVALRIFSAPSYIESLRASASLNNPSYEIYKEVHIAHPRTAKPISIFLSIGTESSSSQIQQSASTSPTTTKFASAFRKLESHLASVSRAVDSLMAHECALAQVTYRRLSVDYSNPNDLSASDLGALTMAQVQRATEHYLATDESRRTLVSCARELVALRRRRCDTLRWERFARGTTYHCMYDGCVDVDTIFGDRNELLDHLRRCHDVESPGANNYEDIKTLLDRGRTYSGGSNSSGESRELVEKHGGMEKKNKKKRGSIGQRLGGGGAGEQKR